MKHITTLTACLFIFFGTLTAQTTPLGVWKVKSAGVYAGFDSDRISGLSHTQLLSQAKSPLDVDGEAFGFSDYDLMTMVCENPNYRAELTLSTPWRNTELRLGAAAMLNRVESLSYHQQALLNDGSSVYRSLYVNASGHEVALDAALNRAFPIGNWFNFYGGLGLQVGKSFNNSMYMNGQNLVPIMETGSSDDVVIGYEQQSETQYSNMYSGTHLRAFVELGAGVTIARRVELLFSMREGVGNRWVPGASLSEGTRTSSKSLGLRWKFGRNATPIIY